MQIGDLVQIDWHDHYSHNSGWKSFAEVKGLKTTTVICSSVGVVIGLDKEQVTLAQNWHPDDKDYRVADFMIVIKRCIKKIHVLRKKVLK